jgi:hypothetical protein
MLSSVGRWPRWSVRSWRWPSLSHDSRHYSCPWARALLSWWWRAWRYRRSRRRRDHDRGASREPRRPRCHAAAPRPAAPGAELIRWNWLTGTSNPCRAAHRFGRLSVGPGGPAAAGALLAPRRAIRAHGTTTPECPAPDGGIGAGLLGDGCTSGYTDRSPRLSPCKPGQESLRPSWPSSRQSAVGARRWRACPSASSSADLCRLWLTRRLRRPGDAGTSGFAYTA